MNWLVQRDCLQAATAAPQAAAETATQNSVSEGVRASNDPRVNRKKVAAQISTEKMEIKVSQPLRAGTENLPKRESNRAPNDPRARTGAENTES